VTLKQIKQGVEAVEDQLSDRPFVVSHTFERNGRRLDIALTDRLRQSCERGRVWKSKAFLTALKNAAYGFDETHVRSPGGSDGIFLLTRDHRPRNAMMKKLFDRFLDKPDSGCEDLAGELGTEVKALQPVRIVSHHMRLLGVLHRRAGEDIVALVDFDNTK
jgi:hypothetical protein